MPNASITADAIVAFPGETEQQYRDTLNLITEIGQPGALVNNAAVCFNDPTLYGRVPHTPVEQQASITVRTNYYGTLGLTQACLPLLVRQLMKRQPDLSQGGCWPECLRYHRRMTLSWRSPPNFYKQHAARRSARGSPCTRSRRCASRCSRARGCLHRENSD